MTDPKIFGNSEKDPVYGYLENPKELIFVDMDGVLNPSSYTDKRLWVEKYLGEKAYKRLIISNDKSLFSGKALIDDRTKYGVTKFKGEHIHFGSDKFPDWNSVLKYLDCL